LGRVSRMRQLNTATRGPKGAAEFPLRVCAGRVMPVEGVVTSLKEEHENSASRIFSNDRDCLAPRVHSRRAKGSVRPCRSEMTLDVESVVGGCVS
jgi:hypothetical protein